jgi:hypothetical protein
MSSHANEKFSLTKKGQIYLVRFAQDWDLKDSKSFFETYKRVVKRDGLARFGVLSDMRLLSSGTPEAIEYFEVIAEWALKKGQIARALLMGSGYEEFIIRRIDKGVQRYPVESFESEEDALRWLEGLGLSVK